MLKLFTTVKTYQGRLLTVPVKEAKLYTPDTVNAYLENGRLVKTGRFCPVVFR